MAKIAYAARPFPKTTQGNVDAILKVMRRKKIVSLEDMQKATGKKWVRRSLQAVKLTRTVEAVRKGRKLLGFTLKMGKGPIKENVPDSRFKVTGSFKSPHIVQMNDGRTTAVVVKPKKRKRAAKKEQPTIVEDQTIREESAGDIVAS